METITHGTPLIKIRGVVRAPITKLLHQGNHNVWTNLADMIASNVNFSHVMLGQCLLSTDLQARRPSVVLCGFESSQTYTL